MTRIAAIILAAGRSRRYGADNKLLAQLGGKPVISHTLDLAARMSFAQRVLIISPDDAEIAALCDQDAFNVVTNPRAADGMGSSIAAGIKCLEACDGAAIILADMPFITEQTYADLFKAFGDNLLQSIIAPTYHQSRGHPVLFRAIHFPALALLEDDRGAKTVIAANKNTALVPVEDRGVVTDIDTPSDLL